jgi:O-antigen/teichoic acid export membrane protein
MELAVTRLRRSLLFSFMDRYAGIGIGLAMTMASARMLTPADFGVFAVGMSVILLIDVLRDFGAGNYLVQLKVLERNVVRSAFTVSFIISGSCAAALALTAIPLGRFYGEPGVAGVVLVLSTALLLNALGTPSIAVLRREMAFGQLAMINVVSGLGQLGAVILLARLGEGYMAMAWAGVVVVALRTLGANIARPMLWAFRPSFTGWREILSFGAWSTATGVVNVIYETLPQLIVGRVLGMAPVGLLGRAQMVCQMPDKLIASALHPVILPALAEHARRGGSLKEPYLLGLSYMAAVHVPAMVCLALLAEPVVLVLLGPQWHEVPPLVRLMATGLIWMFPAFLTYPMLVALGRIRDTLISSLISIPPSILLIAVAAPHGLTAVAAASLVIGPLQVFVAISFVRSHVRITWAEILRAAAPGGVATLAAAGGIVAVMSLLGFRTSLSVGEMMVAIAAAGLGWLGGLRVGDHPLLGELRVVWGQVRRWA